MILRGGRAGVVRRDSEVTGRIRKDAGEQGTWRVSKIGKGEYAKMQYPNPKDVDGETIDAERVPLLRRLEDQVPSVE